MADGRHLENKKPPYFRNGLTNLQKNLTWCRILALRRVW